MIIGALQYHQISHFKVAPIHIIIYNMTMTMCDVQKRLRLTHILLAQSHYSHPACLHSQRAALQKTLYAFPAPDSRQTDS